MNAFTYSVHIFFHVYIQSSRICSEVLISAFRKTKTIKNILKRLFSWFKFFFSYPYNHHRVISYLNLNSEIIINDDGVTADTYDTRSITLVLFHIVHPFAPSVGYIIYSFCYITIV
jgi:hypothetical protein